MTCVVSLVAHANEQLTVSATVEAPWAALRLRVGSEPVEVRVETADTAMLIRALLRAAQQLCATATTSSAQLSDAGWPRAALLLDDALVAIAQTVADDDACP